MIAVRSADAMEKKEPVAGSEAGIRSGQCTLRKDSTGLRCAELERMHN